jgi:hypothetical protein
VQRHEPNEHFTRAQRAIDAMLEALASHVRRECGIDAAG